MATNVLRRYVYEEVCPKYQGKRIIPPVSYDHWLGIENGLNESILSKEIDRAAELGIEYFVVASAWFCGGFPGDNGNWERVFKYKYQTEFIINCGNLFFST